MEEVSYWVQLSDDNFVLECIVVPYSGSDLNDLSYITETLGLNGRWLRTYQDGTRKQYAGCGYFYDESSDVFISPQPYPSWSLDSNFDWYPPVPKPSDDHYYRWDEESLSWVILM